MTESGGTSLAIPNSDYHEAVRRYGRALKLSEEELWEAARLAHEHTISWGESYQKQRATGKVTMERFCADVVAETGQPCSPYMGRLYRTIWDKYGEAHVTQKMTWETARALLARSAEQRANYELKHGSEHASPEAKADALARLAADPQVTEIAAQAARTLVENLPALQREQLIRETLESNPVWRQNVILAEQDRRRLADHVQRDAEAYPDMARAARDLSLNKRVVLQNFIQTLEKWTNEIQSVTSYLEREHAIIESQVEAFDSVTTAHRSALDAVIAAFSRSRSDRGNTDQEVEIIDVPYRQI